MKNVKLYHQYIKESMELSDLNSNFSTWFGKSQVVNKDGSPLIVHHGGADMTFDVFERTRDIGFHFGGHMQASIMCAARNTNHDYYNEMGEEDPAGVGSFYLSLQNPAHLPDLRLWRKADFAEMLGWLEDENGKSLGLQWNSEMSIQDNLNRDDIRPHACLNPDQPIDGIIYHNMYEKGTLAPGVMYMEAQELYDRGLPQVAARDLGLTKNEEGKWSRVPGWKEPRTSYIAFRPNQIKSIYNSGSWSPNNPNVKS